MGGRDIVNGNKPRCRLEAVLFTHVETPEGAICGQIAKWKGCIGWTTVA